MPQVVAHSCNPGIYMVRWETETGASMCGGEQENLSENKAQNPRLSSDLNKPVVAYVYLYLHKQTHS